MLLLRVSGFLVLGLLGCSSRPPRELRVCADPNNLPFSNQRREGFENRLAELVGSELGLTVRYFWWPQRRGFIRNTLAAHHCDLVMGTTSGAELVLTTRPYYRSTYVFVYRKDRGLTISSLDDPVLRKLRIGVQLVGDDYANTPPVDALSRRGIVGNLVGFSVLGDYSKPNPPARIIDAVIAGQVDLALAWGPLAGYFAKRSPAPLEVIPVSPAADSPTVRFAFDISLAVRPEDHALREELNGVLERKRREVDRLLAEYGVPVVAGGGVPSYDR
ncbi:MAG TPA: substrate-binding domain-containing protein [Gemmatimonadales bacterium]|nr:substrate-binding domain-containing protein [Gemmatimonadales bacterium]